MATEFICDLCNRTTDRARTHEPYPSGWFTVQVSYHYTVKNRQIAICPECLEQKGLRLDLGNDWLLDRLEFFMKHGLKHAM